METMKQLDLTRREAYLLLLTEDAFAKGRPNQEAPVFTVRELAHVTEELNRTIGKVREPDLASLLNRMGVFAASRGHNPYRRKTRELIERLPKWLEEAREAVKKGVCVLQTPGLTSHSNTTR